MTTAIHWFRNDLRLTDNPALSAAVQHERIIPLFILDPAQELGGASRWWLHESLQALDKDLQALGSKLILRQGHSLEILTTLIQQQEVTHLYWNRRYEPLQRQLAEQVKSRFREQGLVCTSFNGSLLYEPHQIHKKDGTFYKVFTPFWRHYQSISGNQFGEPLPAFNALPPLPAKCASDSLASFALLPKIPWHQSLAQHWQAGEAEALQRLKRFQQQVVQDYKEGRNFPGVAGTSRLSPYLALGQISPRQIAAAFNPLGEISWEVSEPYVRQLCWRDFAYHLLFHFPDSPQEPLDQRFRHFPWQEQPELLHRWQRGQTGIPIIDAGMRELWQSGWMHNRVRMLVASLLTKNARIPWQQGADWFMDTLVDADLANNSMGWQWVAGCGVDAAPYFRIFNPVLQSEKFDPDGDYVRRWVPELAALPNAWIHKPWLAPAEVLHAAGITLDADYPAPMLDLFATKEAALQGYAAVKSAAH